MVSPLINKDNTVTFHYYDHEAKQVEIFGFFNDWNLVPMVKNEEGVWEYKTSPLKEGTYTYLLKVDGKFIHDPLNPKKNIKPDGLIESILDVGTGDYFVDLKEKGRVEDNENELVIVTLNTHSFQENTDRFKKLVWIAEGLKNLNADLISLNEVVYGKVYSRGYQGQYYNTGKIIQEYLQQLTENKYYLYFSRIGEWKDGENLANAILSKYPLLSSDYTELVTTDKWPAPWWKRNCLFAGVKDSHGRYIHFFVAHTMGWNSRDTYQQIQQIKRFIIQKRREDVFAEIVAGDLNVLPTHKNFVNWLQDDPRLIDSYSYANVENNPERIDYILVGDSNPVFQYATLDSSIIFNDNHFEGNFYPKVSDHFGFVTRFKFKS